MDLERTQRPNLVAFDRDHIGTLLSQLKRVDAVVGSPVVKRVLGQGHVTIDVPPATLLQVARTLRDVLAFEMLTCVSGVDMVDHIDSVYHFRSISQNWLLQVRVSLPVEAPEVDSLVSLYPSANWLEREQYDMVGITYQGHPDLRRILLDDDFQGYPLLKSFRPTPMTVHDRASTQVDAVRAISGENTRNQERVVIKRLGQGNQERVHPGMLTFGSEATFLETGQGVGEGPNVMHGYTVDTDLAGPVMKPQEE